MDVSILDFDDLYAGGGATEGALSSFGEHASMGKGTYECDGSKEPQ